MEKVHKAQWLYIGRKIGNNPKILRNSMNQLNNNSWIKEYNQVFKNGNFISKK